MSAGNSFLLHSGACSRAVFLNKSVQPFEVGADMTGGEKGVCVCADQELLGCSSLCSFSLLIT